MTDATFSLLCGIVLGAASFHLLRIVFSIENAHWLFENYVADRVAKSADVVMPAVLGAIQQGAEQGRWRDGITDSAYINVFGRMQGIKFPKTYRFLCVTMSHLRRAGFISPEVAISMSILARARNDPLDPEVALSRVAPGTGVRAYPHEINSYSYALLTLDVFTLTRQRGEPDPWLDLTDRAREIAHQERVLEYVRLVRLANTPPLAPHAADGAEERPDST